MGEEELLRKRRHSIRRAQRAIYGQNFRRRRKITMEKPLKLRKKETGQKPHFLIPCISVNRW